jgi:hypothetical protein
MPDKPKSVSVMFYAIEGEGTNYTRHPITVKSANGELLAATTYRVIHPRAGLRTNVEYVGYIVRGLSEHGVAAEYIAKVKAIASRIIQPLQLRSMLCS